MDWKLFLAFLIGGGMGGVLGWVADFGKDILLQNRKVRLDREETKRKRIDDHAHAMLVKEQTEALDRQKVDASLSEPQRKIISFCRERQGVDTYMVMFTDQVDFLSVSRFIDGDFDKKTGQLEIRCDGTKSELDNLESKELIRITERGNGSIWFFRYLGPRLYYK